MSFKLHSDEGHLTLTETRVFLWVFKRETARAMFEADVLILTTL